MNRLSYVDLLADLDLSRIVTVPTRIHKMLNVIVTNRPDLFKGFVVKTI